jgi:carboxylesterase
MLPNLIPTGEPFFLPGNSIGCLMVHGLVDSPKEMRWMGEVLNQQGYTVLAVRLAGHATRIKDVERTRWWDWAASVEDGWHLLSGAADQLFLVGFSLGGILSLLFGAHFPVAGLITMSTPYALPEDPRLAFIGMLKWFMPYVQKSASDSQDREAEKGHVTYPAYPTETLIQLRDLLVEMRAALPKVTAPTLLIHSRQDKAIDPGNMPKIYAALGSEDKVMVWLEKSGHLIPQDTERQRAIQASVDFIQRVRGTTVQLSPQQGGAANCGPKGEG